MEHSNDQQQLTNVLLLYRQNFFGSQSHLHPEEVQKLWSQRAAEITSVLTSPAQPTGFDTPASQSVSMSRANTIGSPSYRTEHQVSMSRKRSSPPSLGVTSVSMYSQPVDLPQSGEYTVAKTQRSNSGRPFPTVITVFDHPSDYLNHGKPCEAANPDLAVPFEDVRPPVWSISSDTIQENVVLHQSARTTELDPIPVPQASPLTDLAAFPSTLSHEPPLSSSLCNDLDMMRIKSQASEAANYNSRRTYARLQSRQYDEAINVDFNSVETINHAIGGSDSMQPLPVVSMPIHSISAQLALPEPTVAPTQTISATATVQAALETSSKSGESPSGSSSRNVGHRAALSEPKIAPKTLSIQPPKALARAAFEISHPKSADGKQKCQISKNPVFRPMRKKIKCPQCDRHPDGFKGQHELQRHTERFHRSARKVWICVDGSPDKSRLSNCRACRECKTYGQAHNAAAHLRRIHFNPRSKSPKIKGVSGRAGMGGGDWPPIEELKKSWMREVEQVLTEAESEDEEETGEATQPTEVEDFGHASDEETPEESPLFTPALSVGYDPKQAINLIDLSVNGDEKVTWTKTSQGLYTDVFELMASNDFDMTPNLFDFGSENFDLSTDPITHEYFNEQRRDYIQGAQQVSTTCV